MNSHKILCIGEILWDCFPDGKTLGGAPFNVAYHLKKLGNNVEFVSCVGRDELGQEVLVQVEKLGIKKDNIQVHESLPTGIVQVKLNEKGIPSYIIEVPAAWDAINLHKSVQKIISHSDAIVFGTLAQRNSISKKTIQSIRNAKGLKVLDLNLRAPFNELDIIRESLEIADFLKINDEELENLKKWFQLSGDTQDTLKKLSEIFNLNAICVTYGDEGALLFHEDSLIKSEGIKTDALDTVGAGDAFLSMLLIGYLNNEKLVKALIKANKFGAFITTQIGSTPDYSIKSVTELLNNENPDKNG